MPLRARKLFVHYFAWDETFQQYRAGDAQNHTLYWVKDAQVVRPVNSPIEITENDQHLCYAIELTAEETSCKMGTLVGFSETAGVEILKQTILFEQVIGSGAILINHDYGGTDNLRFVAPSGVGVGGVTIYCFLKDDYDVNRRSRGYIIAESKTRDDGRWWWDMALNPGDYVLVFFKTGQYAPTPKEITVTA